MILFCLITGKTPDELTQVSSPEEALRIQQQIAETMREVGLRAHSSIFRINALHSFWEANGVKLTEDFQIQRLSMATETTKQTDLG
jgi:hypothetical protein